MWLQPRVYWSGVQLTITFKVILIKAFRDLTLSKLQVLDSAKLKEFADDNSKLTENGRKFSKQVENTAGKGEIARYEQFLLFLQFFQKTCTADT